MCNGPGERAALITKAKKKVYLTKGVNFGLFRVEVRVEIHIRKNSIDSSDLKLISV